MPMYCGGYHQHPPACRDERTTGGLNGDDEPALYCAAYGSAGTVNAPSADGAGFTRRFLLESAETALEGQDG